MKGFFTPYDPFLYGIFWEHTLFASMGSGAGVWRTAPKVFPDSSSILDKFQSEMKVHKTLWTSLSSHVGLVWS